MHAHTHALVRTDTHKLRKQLYHGFSFTDMSLSCLSTTAHPLRKPNLNDSHTRKITVTMSAVNAEVHTTMRLLTLSVQHNECGS